MQGSKFGYNVLKTLWKPTHEHYQPVCNLYWISLSKYSVMWHLLSCLKQRREVEEYKTNLMSLTILFHSLCAQHVSDINPYPANVENMVSSY